MTNYTLRQELLEYIRNLKDRDYQENCWVKNNCPPNVEYDELKLTINFLFDDTVFAENPEYYLGAELQDKGEVSAVADVCRELRQSLNKIGVNKEDIEYISDPCWDNVISKAEFAYQLLSVQNS